MKVSDIKKGTVCHLRGVVNSHVLVANVRLFGCEGEGDVEWRAVTWSREEGRWVRLARWGTLGGNMGGVRRLDTFARAAKVIGAWPDERKETA